MSCLRYLLVCLYLAISAATMAQHSLGVVAYHGKVIKHKEDLHFDIPDRSLGIVLSHALQTSGDQAWHHFWGKPEIKHMLHYVHYGDSQVLGSGWAAMRGLDFYLWRKNRWQWQMHFLTGLGYVTKTYDRRENPTNNAIGSHWNNATRIGMDLGLEVAEGWRLGLEAHLLHFSNGRSTTPNSGINTYGIGLGMQYSLDSEQQDQAPHMAYVEPTQDSSRWGLDLQVHLSRTEQIVPGGPKYGNYAVGLALRYRYHPLLTALLGVEYEYKDEIYQFYIRDYATEEESKNHATRTMVTLANDFAFRRLVFRPQVGIYLPYPMHSSDLLYFKLGMHYVLPELVGVQASVGIVLKSHYSVADYVALAIGLRM